MHARLMNIIGDEVALRVLANYCKLTLKCSEKRPCYGDPLVMGDVTVFMNPATYNIGCDREYVYIYIYVYIYVCVYVCICDVTVFMNPATYNIGCDREYVCVCVRMYVFVT